MMLRRTFLLVSIAALMLVSPAPIRAWQLTNSELKAVPMPAEFHSVSPVMSADFDGDGQPETLTLANGHAAIHSVDLIRWQSPPTWLVQQAIIADLNHDGLPEVALLVWRQFKPWPVDKWLPAGGRIRNFHDSADRSCHIILIGWSQNAFRERWAGSALAQPVKNFAAADLTGNGEQLLVTLESEYDDSPSAPARNLKVWEWNGFGFTVVSQMQGSFGQLAIARAGNGQALILAP
jgi:hypothetical protein